MTPRRDTDPEQVSLEAIQGWGRRLEELCLSDAPRQAALARALEEARKGRLEEPLPPTLTILLLGASGVGKSELLNALAGERIARAGHLRPTTTAPTLYVHESVAPARLFEYGAALGEMARSKAALHAHEREELRDKIIIDAPDIDSFRLEHRRHVLELIPAMDVVLYVVTPQTYKNDLGWQTVLAERGRRAFAFVMNKWDAEGKPAVAEGSVDVDEDFLQLLRARGGYENPLLFRVSARYWTAARGGEAPAEETRPWPGDQFLQLEAWLASGLSTSEVEQIQRRRRRAAWGSLAAAVSEALPPAELAGTPWRAEAQAQLAAIGQELWRAMHPALSRRARQLARARDQERRPFSPGPFGLSLRLLSAAGGFWRRPGPLALPAPAGAERPASAAPASGAPQQAGAPAAEEAGGNAPGGLPVNMSQALIRRLTSLEWKARQARLPFEWIGRQWQPTADGVQPRLEEALWSASVELANKPYGWGRRALGYLVFGAVELAMLAIIVLAIWRLGRGYVAGDYLGGVFAANLAALLACVFVVGYALVGLLFTSGEGAFRRELEKRLQREWKAAMGELEAAVSGFFDQAEELRRQGEAVLGRCDREIQSLTSTIQESAASEEGGGQAVDKLFG